MERDTPRHEAGQDKLVPRHSQGESLVSSMSPTHQHIVHAGNRRRVQVPVLPALSTLMAQRRQEGRHGDTQFSHMDPRGPRWLCPWQRGQSWECRPEPRSPPASPTAALGLPSGPRGLPGQHSEALLLLTRFCPRSWGAESETERGEQPVGRPPAPLGSFLLFFFHFHRICCCLLVTASRSP